jgi:hypothetical protein
LAFTLPPAFPQQNKKKGEKIKVEKNDFKGGENETGFIQIDRGRPNYLAKEERIKT